MEEVYVPVKNFEEYKISNYGNVKGKSGIILKGSCTKAGGFYKTVCFYKNKKHYTKRVHRLVAMHFIPNPEKKYSVDHIDRNKQNNKITNLRWATRQEQSDNRKTFRDIKHINISKERYIHIDKRIKNAKKIYVYFVNKKINDGKPILKYFYTTEEAILFRDKIINATIHR